MVSPKWKEPRHWQLDHNGNMRTNGNCYKLIHSKINIDKIKSLNNIENKTGQKVTPSKSKFHLGMGCGGGTKWAGVEVFLFIYMVEIFAILLKRSIVAHLLFPLLVIFIYHPSFFSSRKKILASNIPIQFSTLYMGKKLCYLFLVDIAALITANWTVIIDLSNPTFNKCKLTRG